MRHNDEPGKALGTVNQASREVTTGPALVYIYGPPAVGKLTVAAPGQFA